MNCESSSEALRLLYLGPFNSPHVEDLALAMRERGHVVEAGGEIWGGGLPPSSLPEHGVPIREMTGRSIPWLRRLIGEFRPDVVHAHWLPFATLAALAGARPLVATAWGSDVFCAGRRQLLEARVALRRVSIAMADSDHLLARLEELGPASLHTMTVNWGVDLDTFRVPVSEERAELKTRFGFAAGPLVFSPRGLKDIYNPDIVVAAFARVKARVPSSQLVLKHAGDDTVLPEWDEAAGIHFVGHVEREKVAELFRAADVTVSVPSSDSSPRSVWEAMASGSPTVLSDLPWVKELIADGRDALVVEPQAEAVAMAIDRLLSSDQERERIATSARKLVERHRNRDVELARIEACYRELARS